MIALENTSVSLVAAGKKRRQILKDISLEIPDGDWLVVTGPNGSGKTTLLKLIAGLIPPSSGTLARKNRGGSNAVEFMLFFQDPDNQFVAGSVWKELLLSLSAEELECFNAGDSPAPEDAPGLKLEEATLMFDLRSLLHKNPHSLSGGEKQRLVMACAYLADPDVLLLDEPTSFLDAKNKKECIRFVEEMNEKGKTVVWTCTGGDEMLSAKRGIYLNEGGIEFEGSGEELLAFICNNAAMVLPGMFQAARELVEVIRDASSSKKEEAALIGSALGENGGSYPVRREKNRVVEAESICFGYEKEKRVLRNASFKILSGEIAALTGPNGSGKTTLLEIIGGIRKPFSGRITVDCTESPADVKHNGSGRRGGILYLMQSPERMFFADTVLSEIAFGLRSLKCSSSKIFSIASHALSQVGLDLELLAGRSPFNLSMGEMRRLAFAIALSLRPDLLLMDEPTACLDRGGERALRALVERARNDHVTVVMASHDVDFIASVCDRLIFLEEGEVKDVLRIENQRISSADLWPTGEKPYVLELQESLSPAERVRDGLVLSMSGFFRSLLNDPKAHVP